MGSAARGLVIVGSGFLTQYSYGPLGQLAAVSKHGQTRSFAHDLTQRAALPR